MKAIKTSANMKTLVSIILFGMFTLFCSNGIFSQAIPMKVIIIVMYESGEITGDNAGEAQLWYERDSLFSEMEIAGAYSPLYYNQKGEGLIITGVGVANASSTVMALGMNRNLDLSKTYFIIAGIAGTSPNVCTIGSAVWSDWIVDAGMCHYINPQELPKDWKFSRFRLRCNEPWCEEGATIGTEVFRLDSILVRKAYHLTKKVRLADSQEAKEIRKYFPKNSIARKKPIVTIGDNLAGSTFLFGKMTSEWSDWWVKKWTQGKGTYYTTNMEDNGSLTALKRLSDSKIISYDRILVLRTASNFDQQLPGKNAVESMNDSWVGPIAIENAYRVCSIVVHDIINNWSQWNDKSSE